MTSSGEWLGADDLAGLAGITRRSATRILAAGHWRGRQLEIRQVSGRGGNGGLLYQVALRSLPEPFQTSLSDPVEIPFTLPPLAGLGADELIDLAETCERSEDRVRVIEAWRELTGKSRETAYRKIRAMAGGGHAALLRKKPVNAGAPRVPVSRAFLAAWTSADRPIDEAWALHDRLEQLIAAMWCGPHANAGAGRIAKDAARWLQKWCAEVGFEPTGKAARKVFKVERRRAEKSRGNAVFHRMRTDAAAHYNASPYRTSNLNMLKPMEVLMGDVHHIDVKTRRADGSAAWCIKMITWMDAATRRVWVDLKTCKKGESVTKADVNASLAALFRHPDWGSPDNLLVDNGKEYALKDALTEPMRLAAEAGGRSPVIRSKAYNARGKGLIEGFFGRFERGYLSLMPGWGGGDRMRTPTANQGQEIEPFDGSPDLAEAVISRAVDLYNQEGQRPLGGLSPAEAYDERRGERATVSWSVEALAYALADRTERVNQQGQVKINNRSYELHGAALAASTVTVLHGPFIQGGVLIQCDGELTFAEATPVFAPLDRAGARYASKRRREFDAAVRHRGEALPAVNPLADLIEHHQPTVDLLATQKTAVQLAISPKARKEQGDAAAAALRAKNAADTAILQKALANNIKSKVA